MKRTIFNCDHCGKELDDMHDYIEMEIDDFADYVETDLCARCYDELNNIVLQYLNKKKIL